MRSLLLLGVLILVGCNGSSVDVSSERSPSAGKETPAPKSTNSGPRKNQSTDLPKQAAGQGDALN